METKSVIDFLEKHLPNYYGCNDIARLDDLAKWLNNEMTPDEMEEAELDTANTSEVFAEFDELQNKLFARALKNYTEKTVSYIIDRV